VGPSTRRLFWSSDLPDAPTYRIYVNGRYVRTTMAECADFPMAYFAGESGVVEILDDAVTPPETAIAPRALLAWDNVSGASLYRIERYVDAAWVVVKEIAADQDRYHFWTPPLSGRATAHQFRVTTIGEDENEATPTVISVLMTRHPDPPIVSFSFSDSTKKVTVAAA
jgi:hypothetical protein